MATRLSRSTVASPPKRGPCSGVHAGPCSYAHAVRSLRPVTASTGRVSVTDGIRAGRIPRRRGALFLRSCRPSLRPVTISTGRVSVTDGIRAGRIPAQARGPCSCAHAVPRLQHSMCLGTHRNAEEESRTLPQSRFHPDTPAVHLDDVLRDREAETRCRPWCAWMSCRPAGTLRRSSDDRLPAMPGPVSATDTTNAPPELTTRTATSPFSVNLIALPTRLSSTCVIRRSSPWPIGRPAPHRPSSAAASPRPATRRADDGLHYIAERIVVHPA